MNPWRVHTIIYSGIPGAVIHAASDRIKEQGRLEGVKLERPWSEFSVEKPNPGEVVEIDFLTGSTRARLVQGENGEFWELLEGPHHGRVSCKTATRWRRLPSPD